MDNSANWVEGDGVAGPVSTFLNSLPRDQQNAAALLIANINILAMYANDFNAAVKLIDWVEDTERLHASRYFPDFKDIAARDAIMTFFHFGECLKFIRNGAKDLPPFVPYLRQLQAALTYFNDRYPDEFRRNIRDAVAHRAELTKTLEHFKAGAVEGQRIIGRLDGRNYTITNRAVHAKLPITQDTHLLLVNVAQRVLSAFPLLTARMPQLHSPAV